jgi:hypothetical protein
MDKTYTKTEWANMTPEQKAKRYEELADLTASTPGFQHDTYVQYAKQFREMVKE